MNRYQTILFDAIKVPKAGTDPYQAFAVEALGIIDKVGAIAWQLGGNLGSALKY